MSDYHVVSYHARKVVEPAVYIEQVCKYGFVCVSSGAVGDVAEVSAAVLTWLRRMRNLRSHCWTGWLST